MIRCLIDFLLNIPAPNVWNTQVLPHLRSTGYISSESLLNNLHSIIYITSFYHVVFIFCAWFMFPRLSDWRISAILEKEKGLDIKHKYSKQQRSKSLSIQASMHLVSFLQTVVVLYLSIGFLIDPALAVEPYPTPTSRIFSETRETQVICIFAIGYFIWDTLISLVYSTLPFALHGIVSTIVYVIGIKPYLQYYAPVFLIFELSNPFLNFRWFGLKYFPEENKICSKLLHFNNLTLMITFFIGRIAWGWYQIAKLCYDFYMVRNDPRFMFWDTMIIVSGNFVLDILNVIWFSTMVSVAVKVIRGNK